MKNKKHIFKNRAFLTVFLSVIIFTIISILPEFFVILDKKISYYFLNLKNNNTYVHKDILIVELDENSIKKIWKFPFSRWVYSELIKNLNEKWVSVIWFDIIFSEDWYYKLWDESFSNAINKWWNVILWWPIIDNWKKSILQPIQKFQNWWNPYWYFNPEVHSISRESYSFSASKSLNITEKINESKVRNTKKDFNHFTIEILKKYFGRNNIDIFEDYFSIIPWERIPYSDKSSKEVLINYLPEKKFKNKISLSDIYLKEGKFDETNFENKIILIWATAKWLKDIFNTPNWVDFWIYIHANIINTILSGNFLVYFNENLEKILTILLIVLSVYFNLSNNNKVLIISNIALFLLFLFLFNYLLWFKVWVMLNNPAHIIFAFILAVTFSNISKYLTENKDKRKMLNALSEYISKDIASEILNNSWNIKLEWERKRISIFFSDIEWFTTISEKMDAWELVIFLREYLWAMSNIIMDERWLIDKYEWDAIMALWWVFGHESKSSFDNCSSALKQQKVLENLNISWKKKFGQELKIRMGLNIWEAIVWNIWATWRKMEFTALWDSVNLASRLEEINKQYWTYICVSESIYMEQKDNFEFRYLDKIKVKWKNIPTSIYELLSKKGELSDLKKDIILGFNIWIDLYLKQEFKKASKIFEKLWKLWDKPSLTYAKRCLQFEIIWPGKDWDGVWVMKTK